MPGASTAAAAESWESWSYWKGGEGRGACCSSCCAGIEKLMWAAAGLRLLPKEGCEQLLHDRPVLSPMLHLPPPDPPPPILARRRRRRRCRAKGVLGRRGPPSPFGHVPDDSTSVFSIACLAVSSRDLAAGLSCSQRQSVLRCALPPPDLAPARLFCCSRCLRHELPGGPKVWVHAVLLKEAAAWASRSCTWCC